MSIFGTVRNRIASLTAALLLSVAAGLGIAMVGPASAANAATGVNMHLVCQYTAGKDSYKAVLKYHSAFGWRCVDRAGIRPTMGANIWGYCVNVLGYNGAYNNDTSNPYSWYCA